MRELFEEVMGHSPLDPHEAARQGARPTLRKRFYETVDIVAAPGGFAITLDGRPLRTPAKRAFVAPHHALGRSLMAEWQAQREVIEPAAMPLTRLANTVIDGVADRRAEVTDDVAKYFESDLVFYRAEHPDALVARQAQHWDPLLAWMAETFGARFVLAAGIVHVAQPASAITAARMALPRDPWALGALHVVTTVTGSAVLGLALARGRLDVTQVWSAAHVDEDWNLDRWGLDEEVAARRAARLRDVEAAAEVLEAVRDGAAAVGS